LAQVGDNRKQAGRERSRNIFRAFLASSTGTAVSRVLGAVRDITIANLLGAGSGSDAFWIAFTVPNVFRRFVADEGLTGALIPALSKAEKEENTQSARKLANSTLTALLLANILLCALGLWKADLLVKAFAYGFIQEPAKFELTVTLTRWLFPFLFFVSLVSFLEGLLNQRNHFFIPKLAPGIVSASIAVSAILLAGKFEKPEYALVAGVLAGGLLHLIVTSVPTLMLWGKLALSFTFSSGRFKSLLKEMGKVLLIGLLAQVNIIVLRQLASLLGDGAVTRYWYANRLVDLAQGIVAVGISSALLPSASASVAEGDEEGMKHGLSYSFRLASFLLLPAATIIAVFAEPISSILFRHGRYSVEDVRWTASTLRLLAPFLLSVAGINIIKKIYFAIEDRNTLLLIGGLGVILTGILGWFLIGPYNILGLAGALSLSSIVQFGAYLWLLHKKLDTGIGLLPILIPLGKMIAACLPPAVLLYLLSFLGDWTLGPMSLKNLAIIGCGLPLAGMLYLFFSRILGLAEAKSLLAKVGVKNAR